jgi:hypothetical protein
MNVSYIFRKQCKIAVKVTGAVAIAAEIASYRKM